MRGAPGFGRCNGGSSSPPWTRPCHPPLIPDPVAAVDDRDPSHRLCPMPIPLTRALVVLAAVLMAVVAGLSQPAPAASDQRIAAVVNDDVISFHDIETRLALVLATTNVEPTQETRQR